MANGQQELLRDRGYGWIRAAKPLRRAASTQHRLRLSRQERWSYKASGHLGRGCSRGQLMEHRTGGRRNQPPQDDQAPDVWACRFRNCYGHVSYPSAQRDRWTNGGPAEVSPQMRVSEVITVRNSLRLIGLRYLVSVPSQKLSSSAKSVSGAPPPAVHFTVRPF